MKNLTKIYESIIIENDEEDVGLEPMLPNHTILPPRIINDTNFTKYIIERLDVISNTLKELSFNETPLWNLVERAKIEAGKYNIRGEYKSRHYPVTESMLFSEFVVTKLFNIKSHLKYLDMEDTELYGIIIKAIEESKNSLYN